MSGKPGALHYSLKIKKEAVRLVVEEHQTYAEVAKQLGMRKAERIERWVHMFREEGELSFHKVIGRPRIKESEQSELERLRMENALLKKFHSELRKMELEQRNIGRSTTTKRKTQ